MKQLASWDNMRKKIVSCGFTDEEVRAIDALITKGAFISRSDAVRLMTKEYLSRREEE